MRPSIGSHLFFGGDYVKAGHMDKQPEPGRFRFGHEGVIVGPVANLWSTAT